MKIAPQIVFVNRYYDPDQSATSQMLTDLARGLVARRFFVHVVCSRQLYDDSTRRLPRREVVGGVQVHRVTTTRFGRAHLFGRALDYVSFYVAAAARLIWLLRRGDILVVKTDPPLMSIMAAPIAIVRGVVFINWQQDVFPEVASHLGANPLPSALNKRVKWLRDASLRAARINVVIGSRMREYFLKRGIPSSQVCLIENWSDAQAIRPKLASMSELRQLHDLQDRFVVCYSGNLGRAHEFDTFLDAATELRNEPRFVFLIIGGGAKMDTLKRAVQDRGLGNFRFLPYQPRDTLEDSLAAADVHLVSLMPALEGFIVPSKVYGILAAGRPLIFIGDLDGETARLVKLGRLGQIVAVGDSSGLSNVLRTMAADSSERSAMGARAREIFCEHHTLQLSVDRWRALIDRVRL